MKAVKKSVARKKQLPNYLTKRILTRAAKAGVRQAAAQTMQVMGYTIVAKDGWVVKAYADGRIEKLSAITTTKRPRRIALD